MSTLVSEHAGRYFDGRSTRAVDVRVRYDHEGLHLRDGIAGDWPCEQVCISERIGRSQRRILLPDGAFVEVADGPQWDDLRQAGGAHMGLLQRLEAHWQAVLFSAVATLVLCWAAYVWLLPAGVEWVSRWVPETWVSRLSSESLTLLDQVYTEPSALPVARRDALQASFASWRIPDGPAPSYRLHFRKGTRLGANALALPSGDIVITDELILKAGHDDEILGVLAHELGHVHARHALRQTVQGALLVVVANLMLGDAADMTGTVAGLLSLRYSRDFEREADDYAARMMRANGRDPAHLGRLLQRLDDGGSKGIAYLRTHPVTEERARRLGVED